MTTHEPLHPDSSSSSDASTLDIGDHISVRRPHGFPYRTIVEEPMSALNVMWVRELSTGDRRMICTDDHTILRD